MAESIESLEYQWIAAKGAVSGADDVLRAVKRAGATQAVLDACMRVLGDAEANEARARDAYDRALMRGDEQEAA